MDGSSANDRRAKLLAVLDAEHVARGAAAIRGRRCVARATRTSGATRASSAASAIWRSRDATPVPTDISFRTVVIGGAGRAVRRTRVARTEGHAGLSGV